MKKTKPFIWVTFFFTFFLTQVTLEAQEPVILDSKMKPGISNDMRIEELKVRWKKAALENCPGVPCVTTAVPGAPTAVVATAGNASASISFVAPTNNGGSVVTGYTVTSNPGSFIGTGTTSPINVTGLTNGTAYTFTVVATNAVGNSVASVASSSVTPAVPNTVPGPPTAVVATAGNASASVAFVAPTNNGGSVVTGYTVTSNPGSFIGTGTTSPINVTGLTNGTAYTFTIVATNAVGNSVASAASTAVTPVVPNTVPGAPTAVIATAGNASASIAFLAPSNNGGSTITSYTVTSNPGGITGTGSGSPITVTGLTNGTSYTFTVVATNSVGSSVASSASTAVTPITACGSVTNISDHQGNSYPTVSIGNQCWMASNLRVTTYNDGNATVIPDESANSDANWGTLPTGALTIYPGVTAYGYLYNWHAITDSRKICPNGWHIPTDAEWNTLANFLDPLTLPVSVNNGYESLVAGGMMKSTDALWINNTGANNTSGFSALPGGFRKDNGSFLIGQGAYFWSSTPHSTNNAWYRQLESGFTRLGRFMNQNFTFNKSAGASVRCLRD
jgi:uncharacterized protein (TIGR02145 family)